MKEVIILDKKEGQTPLRVIENFKNKNPEYLNIPITYAGRLDPMASGVLLLLAGKKIKQKEKYLALDKKYDFSVLFGFSTDTYDILGKLQKNNFNLKNINISKIELAKQIQSNLKYFKGSINQKYPAYSSKTVNGKPLFSYARSNEKVVIPERNIFIKEIKLAKISKIKGLKLFLNIKKRVSRVEGDFRQKEILRLWKKSLFGKNRDKLFFIAHFSVSCSSGTYVRQIANTLGKKIKIPALAFAIRRTKIGKLG